MRTFSASLITILLLSLVVAAQSQTAALEGFWQGEIRRGEKIWRVNFDIKREGENYKAFADFVDVDGYGREFKVTRNGENFRLERAQPNGIPIVFEGKIERDVFQGNWSGFGVEAAFSLKRGKAKPKFYEEREVSFKNGDVTLAGTLLTPIKKGKSAAVIITHGSTPNERAAYKSWAFYFVRKGIAALIYDKRGAGKSSGDTRSASMEDLAGDAVAGVNFLKTQPDINPKKIGVAGHSQGGWIAPLAATKSGDVAFVVASAASGVSPDEQSIYHRANVLRENGFSESQIETASRLRERLYASGRMILENDPQAKTEREKISAELEKYNKEPWFELSELPPDLKNDNPSRGGLELLFFDPVPMWEKLRVPVLLVWGDKDSVVPVERGKAVIENALRHAGNENYTVKIFPNVDHGAIVVRAKEAVWDFPRVALDYYELTAEWAARQTTNAPEKLSDEAAESRAVAAIEKLGGKIERDAMTRAVVKIDLNKTLITDADVQMLASAFPDLRWLDLRITPISDAGIAPLGKLRKLEFLNLFRTDLSDAGLSELKQLKSLETLLIGGTKITDDGLKNLEKFSKLKKLSVFRTAVSDGGLKHLEKLSSLEILLIGESKITQEGAKSLQTVLPKLKFNE